MLIYGDQNVYDAAVKRINFLFDEFETVVVGMSGGKDSTVIFNLCLAIARERNRLPLKVLWIDQEGEWQATVDFNEWIMTHPDVEPMWFQMPMLITNNASSFDRYAYCWKEGEEWIHDKHPLSIKENVYGVDRFHDLFEAIFTHHFPNQSACYISGVRTEENIKRLVALTHQLTYKWITWGKKYNKAIEHYAFYPIYDWSYRDVWKAIHNNKWKYNPIYNRMYQLGKSIYSMRVSNLHHETAVQDLLMLQEIEPETWEKMAKRIKGANTISHLNEASFRCPKELPYMFQSWEEYACHLINNIIQEEKHVKMLQGQIKRMSAIYTDIEINNTMWQKVINTVLSSDWDFTKLHNWELGSPINAYRSVKKGTSKRENFHKDINSRYMTPELQHKLIKFFEHDESN